MSGSSRRRRRGGSSGSAGRVFDSRTERRLLQLVTELMAIPGRSGEEDQVLEFVRRQLRQAGVPDSAVHQDRAHRRSQHGGRCGNLIVRLPGTMRGPRRLLMAHVDTVPLCLGSRPVRRGDLIRSADPATALGADDRAGVAVLLFALTEVVQGKRPHPPLTFLFTVQEEVGLLGARNVAVGRLGRPRLCFNFDGGEPWLVTVGATGDYAIDVEVQGVASHAGAHPEDGVSATAVASLAVARLVEEGWHGLIEKDGHVGTANVGVIQGGLATNVVAPSVTIKAEARSHDPAFRRRIVEQFRRAFDDAARQVRNVHGQTARVSFRATLKYESFRLSESDPSVVAAKKAIEAAGLTPELRICNGGLDANWLTAHGLPTVTLGAGQHHIHTADECLVVTEFLQACRVALLLATGAEQA